MDYMDDASSAERGLLDRACQTRTPISGSIELLPLCNMNCNMCYVRLSRAQMEAQGRLRTKDEWLHIARQMKDAGTLFLLLTGGEPLLYPDFRPLYLALRDLGMLITINTNGTLLDEDWAAFFGAHKPRRINVTLYGADERAYASLCHYPGGFEKTVSAVRLLRAQGVDVKLSVSLTRQNAADLPRLLEIGESLGVPVRVDTYMTPASRERSLPFDTQSRLGPEEAAQARIAALSMEMKPEQFRSFVAGALWQTSNILPDHGQQKMHCLAGKCSFTINWQGRMRPCVVMTSPEADVFESGFISAWRQIAQETEKMVLSPACGQCSLRPICRTCASCALFETGSYDGTPEYMCRYAQETLRCLIRAADGMRADSQP